MFFKKVLELYFTILPDPRAKGPNEYLLFTYSSPPVIAPLSRSDMLL
jgi:hypothetical protein